MKEAITTDPKIAGLSKEIRMEKGKRVYLQTCFACHQPIGAGLPPVFPPLAKSDFLMADKTRVITAVVKGLAGPIKVNGQDFNGVMPPVMLTDEQIADVVTYVRNSWGNDGDLVTVDELYQLESTWTSDVGRQIKLGALRGRPQVLALFFYVLRVFMPAHS
jgi:nitrite reductase (NO-forming)